VKKYVSIVGALLIVTAVTFAITAANDHPVEVTSGAIAAEIDLRPTVSDQGGVNLDSEFLIQSNVALNARQIKEKLTLSPAVGFTVKQNAKGSQELRIVPDQPLDPNRIYRFALALDEQPPLKWAFQTKGKFSIVSTLPRDKSALVPIDSGIEINFSHLNFEEIKDYFSISPKVDGNFIVHKKTAVFISKKLEPATVYTVTVKKGLPLAGSDQVLQEDYTFQFETDSGVQGKGQDYDLSFYRSNLDFTTEDTPLIPVGYYNRNQEELPEVQVGIYRYPDASAYIEALSEREKIPSWASRSREKYREDTSSLNRVAEFVSPLKAYDYRNILEFPEPMPAGFYVAEVSVKDFRGQLWFQVTDLGIYAAYADNKTLVWVNDLLSGIPVAETVVRAEGKEQGVMTGPDGLAELTALKGGGGGPYITVTKGNQTAVAAVGHQLPWDEEREKLREKQRFYWKYLYLDRGLYKPNDTVNFWGLVKPRMPGVNRPEQITAAITKWGGWQDQSFIASKEIKLNEFTFDGNIKLPNLLPGYYYLTVKDGEQLITQQGFEVKTYSKPAYQVEITPNRKAVFVGEPVDFKLKAAFFEGTGAANIPFDYRLQDKKGTLTTDSRGEAGLKYLPMYEGTLYGPVQHRYLQVNADLPESGEITGRSSVIVLNNDLEIEADGSITDGTGSVHMKLYQLTVDKVNSGSKDPWEQDAFRSGSAADQTVTVKVYYDHWEKVEEGGEYYDFINKKVRKKYHYQYQKIFVTQGQVTTNQDGSAGFTFPASGDRSYRVELSTQDTKGNLAAKEIYLIGPNFYRESDYQWYHLEPNNQSGKYSTGETVRVVLKNNEAVVASREKGFLYFTARDGVLNSYVRDDSSFTTEFDAEFIPNVWLKGVYFDGRYYYETPAQLAAFDTAEKALDIQVSTDRRQYRPKDTVKVSLEVKDKQGRPVEAKVNLNLVDEALFALKDQHVDILRSLYGDLIPSGVNRTVSTHHAPVENSGGAEHGGEGESDRKDFKDAVFFKTITTDQHGRAQVSFQVPDNLTSWRLTYQAVTKSLQAGNGTSKIKVKLPFFLDMVLNNTYLTGDRPVIPVRSFGNQLNNGAEVTYTARLKSNAGEIKNIVLTGKAFEPVQLELPPLKAGGYELTVTGKSGQGLTDTLTLTFDVVETLMTRQHTDFYLLDEMTKINGSPDSISTLVFTDYQRSQYLNTLWRLLGVGGSRIEQRLAAAKARDLLEEYFPDTRIMKDAGTDFLKYQSPDGGIAILPYADSDLALSAKIAALGLEGFDNSVLTQYFYRVMNDPKQSRERGIIALYGLAALKEPVLREVDWLSRQEDLTVKEQLYLILALTESGDRQRALSKLEQLFLSDGEKIGAAVRINMGEDQDDVLEATALAAVAAATLDAKGQNQLQQYLLDNHTTAILTYIEQLLFLDQALTRMPQEKVGFSYIVDGKKKEVTLEPGQTLSLHLTPEKLADLQFKGIQGQVGVTVVYESSLGAEGDTSVDGSKVTRKYSSPRSSGNELRVGDLVQVNISYQFGSKAPDGTYQITDYLPAGLKVVERPYNWGVKHDTRLNYPVQVSGQKSVFVVGHKNGSFHYYARVIGSGEFKAEKAVLQHLKSGKIYSMTGDDRVIIK